MIGEAAKPQGWGLNDYRREFLRLEAGEEIAERLIDPVPVNISGDRGRQRDADRSSWNLGERTALHSGKRDQHRAGHRPDQ